MDYSFSEEVYSDGGLHMEACTLAYSLNLLLIYFSIMLDLPTPWSPRKAILYLILELFVVVDMGIIQILYPK